MLWRILGNILWLILGGLEAAIGYFTASFFMVCTIIGIPFAWQTLKIGVLCLWPFGARVVDTSQSGGCVTILMNVVWIIFGGLWSCLCHLFFGALLCITIVGIPWGKQHFKMALLALMPFGKSILYD
ncbi:MAG: YccF domain-containing protein [Bacteroidales bacterium]|nr:YccF domain-containing protein [Bacteroidales bacterium]